jgi:hypothetical protein
MEQAKALFQISDHILNLLTRIILDCFIAMTDIAVHKRGSIFAVRHEKRPMKLWQRMKREYQDSLSEVERSSTTPGSACCDCNATASGIAASPGAINCFTQRLSSPTTALKPGSSPSSNLVISIWLLRMPIETYPGKTAD